METKIIEIPSSLAGYKIEHFKYLVDLQKIRDKGNPSVSDKLTVCRNFSGQPESYLRQFNLESLNGLYESILQVLDSHRMKAIPTEVEYGDKVYSFILNDPTTVPISWVMDFTASDYQKHPEKLAAMSYVEKGMVYNQVDHNQNILNGNDKRMEVFRQKMTLDRYLDLSAFFLKLLTELTKSSTVRNRIDQNQLSKLRRHYGRISGMKQFELLLKSTESEMKKLKSGT